MSRCALKFDANADGIVTISDLPLAAWRAFCAPGDWILDLLARAPDLAAFLELPTSRCGGGAAFFVSIFAYIAALYLWAVLMNALHDGLNAVGRLVRFLRR